MTAPVDVLAAANVLAVIEHDGDQWRVIAKGVTRPEDGFIYCHLASNTRFVQQRNGKRPVQTLDWIAPEVLA